jgi:hypothetical protein
VANLSRKSNTAVCARVLLPAFASGRHGFTGKAARILYNKIPFARLHGLLVSDPVRQIPHYLTPELHGWTR